MMREPRFSSTESENSSFDTTYSPREAKDILEYRRDQAKLRRSIESQDLPIRKRLEELTDRLVETAHGTGTLLLKAETGAGKSVYSPVALRAALKKLGRPDKIIVLQPKRDAASGVASAVAAVMGEELGRGVGFSTSEAKVVRSTSAVRVVTPGILVRYLQRGWLTKEQIGAIVIDEVHDGSIDYHLALALIKKLQDEGKAPLTLLTSATPNTEMLSRHFGLEKDSIMEVEGRAYPVETNYLPEEELKRFGRHERGYLDLVTREVRKYCEKTTDGDVLVFLPGSGEIHDVMNRLRDLSDVEVLPLYGRLKPSERARALNSDGSKTSRRRIILSTNIAETSVTVPGVKHVIDSCRERISSYNQQEAVRETPTVFITKGTAEQRAGRAGRVEGGTCVRLISKERYDELPEHQIAEIHRSNLTQLVLKIKGMGLDPLSFKLPEPPPPGALEKGIVDLQRLGALDDKGNLTERGERMKDMAHFSPEISGMILKAEDLGCRTAALAVAAFEREDKVFPEPDSDMINRFGRDEAVDQIEWRHRQTFGDHDSDFIKSLAVFREALKQGVVEAMNRENLPGGYYARERFTRWCDDNFVSPAALTHIAYRLSDYAFKDEDNNKHAKEQENFSYNGLYELLEKTDLTNLSRAILAGHADRLMYYVKDSTGKRGSYRRLGDPATAIGLSSDSATYKSVVIGDDPSSWGARTHENRQPPALCVAGSIDKKEDGGYKAKKIHPVALAELMEVMPHLVTCEEKGMLKYNDRKGIVEVGVQVMLRENNQVTLGTIDRPKDGPEAVRVFAQALARGLVDAAYFGGTRNFIEENQAVLERLAELEKRFAKVVRKPSLDTLADWYTKQLGTIASVEALGETPSASLFLKFEDFVSPEQLQNLETQFPATISFGGDTVFPVTYEPSGSFLSFYDPEDFDNLAPEQKIISATISGLQPEKVSDEEWERWFAISEEQLPKLGNAEHPVTILFKTINRQGTEINYKDWAALKTNYDELRLMNRCDLAEAAARADYQKAALGERSAQGLYFRRLDQKIPDMGFGQFSPVVLPVDRQGKSLIRYPAISIIDGVVFQGKVPTMQADLILVKTAAEAEAIQRQSLHKQEQALRVVEEKRRVLEREKVLLELADELRRLERRFFGMLTIPSYPELERKYNARLIPLTDVWQQATESGPKLTVEDVVNPELLKMLDGEFPAKIFLAGRSYDVVYKPSTNQEPITAVIKMHDLEHLSDEAWERIYNLADADVPKFGSDEHPVQRTFSLSDTRSSREPLLTWEDFRTRADHHRLEEKRKKILENAQRKYDRLVFGDARRIGAYYELPVTSAIFSANAHNLPPITLPPSRDGSTPTMFAIPELVSDIVYDNYRSLAPLMKVRLRFVSSAEKAEEIRQKNEMRRATEAEKIMPLYEADRQKTAEIERTRRLAENRLNREQFVKKNEESYTQRRFPDKATFENTAKVSLNQGIPVLDSRNYLHIVLPPDEDGRRVPMYPVLKVLRINSAEPGRSATASVRVIFVDSEEEVRSIQQEQQNLSQEWRRFQEAKPEIEAVKKTAEELKQLFDRIKRFQAFGKESRLTGYRYKIPEKTITPEEFEETAAALKFAVDRLPNDQPPFFVPGKGVAEARSELDNLRERFRRTLEAFKLIESIDATIKEKMGDEYALRKSLQERGLNEGSARQMVTEATGAVAQYLKNKQMYFLDGKPEAGDPVQRLLKVREEIEQVYSAQDFLSAHRKIEDLVHEHRQALREQPRDYQLWTPPPTAEELAEAARARQAAYRPASAPPVSFGKLGDQLRGQKAVQPVAKVTAEVPVSRAEAHVESKKMSDKETETYRMVLNFAKRSSSADANSLAVVQAKIESLLRKPNFPNAYDAAWPAKFNAAWQEIPKMLKNNPDAQEIVKEGYASSEALEDAYRRKLATSVTEWARQGYNPPIEEWLKDVLSQALS